MNRTSLKSVVVALICGLLGIVIRPVAAEAQADAESGRDDQFHILFLAADAPLWLVIRLDGAENGIHSVRERYAALMIQSVDADGNGFADETEASQLPASGRFGPDEESLNERWKSFDRDPTDGKLSPAEYLAAVNSRLGPVFTTRRKPPLLAQSVQLLSRLDQDGDSRISQSEIVDATQRLIPFDFDDDGTFSPAELQPFPQSMVDAAIADELGAEAQPFVLVDASTDRSELLSRVYRKYATAQGIPLQRSGLSEFAFREHDKDADGWLNQSESQALLLPRPVVEIGINLPAGRVTLRRSQRDSRLVEVLPLDNARRVALRLGSEAVEFSAHDNRYAASDQVKLLKIRFLQADTDKNGYMGPTELMSLAGLNASFEEIDADSDGKVFIDELDRFLRAGAYLTQCAVEMEVESVEKPLFTILDVNLDRRLTAREFAAGSQRLQEFDQDADGILDTRELDLLRRFRVKFAYVVPPAVRPERDMAMMSDRRMPLVNRTAQSGPEWFQNMDRNQDGDVTWREFLGPREAFDRLDADSSGWIEESEAGGRR